MQIPQPFPPRPLESETLSNLWFNKASCWIGGAQRLWDQSFKVMLKWAFFTCVFYTWLCLLLSTKLLGEELLEPIVTAFSGFKIRLPMIWCSSNSGGGKGLCPWSWEWEERRGGLRTASATRAGNGKVECCWVTSEAKSQRADFSTKEFSLCQPSACVSDIPGSVICLLNVYMFVYLFVTLKF